MIPTNATGPARVLATIHRLALDLDTLPTQEMIAEALGVSQQYVSAQMAVLADGDDPCIVWLSRKLYRVAGLRMVADE